MRGSLDTALKDSEVSQPELNVLLRKIIMGLQGTPSEGNNWGDWTLHSTNPKAGGSGAGPSQGNRDRKDQTDLFAQLNAQLLGMGLQQVQRPSEQEEVATNVTTDWPFSLGPRAGRNSKSDLMSEMNDELAALGATGPKALNVKECWTPETVHNGTVTAGGRRSTTGGMTSALTRNCGLVAKPSPASLAGFSRPWSQKPLTGRLESAKQSVKQWWKAAPLPLPLPQVADKGDTASIVSSAFSMESGDTLWEKDRERERKKGCLNPSIGPWTMFIIGMFTGAVLVLLSLTILGLAAETPEEESAISAGPTSSARIDPQNGYWESMYRNSTKRISELEKQVKINTDKRDNHSKKSSTESSTTSPKKDLNGSTSNGENEQGTNDEVDKSGSQSISEPLNERHDKQRVANKNANTNGPNSQNESQNGTNDKAMDHNRNPSSESEPQTTNELNSTNKRNPMEYQSTSTELTTQTESQVDMNENEQKANNKTDTLNSNPDAATQNGTTEISQLETNRTEPQTETQVDINESEQNANNKTDTLHLNTEADAQNGTTEISRLENELEIAGKKQNESQGGISTTENMESKINGSGSESQTEFQNGSTTNETQVSKIEHEMEHNVDTTGTNRSVLDLGERSTPKGATYEDENPLQNDNTDISGYNKTTQTVSPSTPQGPSYPDKNHLQNISNNPDSNFQDSNSITENLSTESATISITQDNGFMAFTTTTTGRGQDFTDPNTNIYKTTERETGTSSISTGSEENSMEGQNRILVTLSTTESSIRSGKAINFDNEQGRTTSQAITNTEPMGLDDSQNNVDENRNHEKKLSTDKYGQATSPMPHNGPTTWTSVNKPSKGPITSTSNIINDGRIDVLVSTIGNSRTDSILDTITTETTKQSTLNQIVPEPLVTTISTSDFITENQDWANNHKETTPNQFTLGHGTDGTEPNRFEVSKSPEEIHDKSEGTEKVSTESLKIVGPHTESSVDDNYGKRREADDPEIEDQFEMDPITEEPQYQNTKPKPKKKKGWFQRLIDAVKSYVKKVMKT